MEKQQPSCWPKIKDLKRKFAKEKPEIENVNESNKKPEMEVELSEPKRARRNMNFCWKK